MLAVNIVEGRVRAVVTDNPNEVGTEVVVIDLEIDQPMLVTRHTVGVVSERLPEERQAA